MLGTHCAPSVTGHTLRTLLILFTFVEEDDAAKVCVSLMRSGIWNL